MDRFVADTRGSKSVNNVKPGIYAAVNLLVQDSVFQSNEVWTRFPDTNKVKLIFLYFPRI